jgi:hypothetical protein
MYAVSNLKQTVQIRVNYENTLTLAMSRLIPTDFGESATVLPFYPSQSDLGQ